MVHGRALFDIPRVHSKFVHWKTEEFSSRPECQVQSMWLLDHALLLPTLADVMRRVVCCRLTLRPGLCLCIVLQATPRDFIWISRARKVSHDVQFAFSSLIFLPGCQCSSPCRWDAPMRRVVLGALALRPGAMVKVGRRTHVRHVPFSEVSSCVCQRRSTKMLPFATSTGRMKQ